MNRGLDPNKSFAYQVRGTHRLFARLLEKHIANSIVSRSRDISWIKHSADIPRQNHFLDRFHVFVSLWQYVPSKIQKWRNRCGKRGKPILTAFPEANDYGFELLIDILDSKTDRFRYA